MLLVLLDTGVLWFNELRVLLVLMVFTVSTVLLWLEEGVKSRFIFIFMFILMSIFIFDCDGPVPTTPLLLLLLSLLITPSWREIMDGMVRDSTTIVGVVDVIADADPSTRVDLGDADAVLLSVS